MDPYVYVCVRVSTESCEFSERIGNNGAGDRETDRERDRERKREERRMTAENNAIRTSRTGNASDIQYRG